MVVMAALVAAAQAVFEQGIVNLTQKRPQKCWKFLALLLTFGIVLYQSINYQYQSTNAK